MTKHVIEVDDEVVFLHCQFLFRGTVTKVNKKTYRIDVPAQHLLDEFVKLVKKERVVNITDTFAVVWEKDVGVNGRYRIEQELYIGHHSAYQAWSQPYMYIVESKDE